MGGRTMASTFLALGSEDGEVDAFTDGSTVPGSLEQSGYGVAIRRAGDAGQTKAEYSGSCKASGNNYLAECLAMLCATQKCLIKIRSPLHGLGSYDLGYPQL